MKIYVYLFLFIIPIISFSQNGALIIGEDDRQDIQIYNTLGECVLSVWENGSSLVQRVDVSGLPVGMYFVRIGNQSNLFVKY